MTIVRLGQLSADTRYVGEAIAEENQDLSIVSGGYTGVYGYESDLGTPPAGIGFSPTSQLRAGCWFKHNGTSINSGSSVPIIRVRSQNSVNAHRVNWFQTVDQLKMIIAPSTEVLTKSAFLTRLATSNHWQHAGVHIKAGESGFFSFYLNGALVFNYEGDLGEDFEAVFFGGSDNTNGLWQDAIFDDMYVDSTVAEDDGPAPAIRFYPSLPVGSGEDFEWEAVGESATYQCVQNAPPLETELAFANMAALKDTHLMANIDPLLGQQVHAVIPYVICRKTNPAIDGTILVHLFDGVTYAASLELSPGIGTSHLWDRQTAQPDTSPWNETDVNLVEMGYESAGDYS